MVGYLCLIVPPFKNPDLMAAALSMFYKIASCISSRLATVLCIFKRVSAVTFWFLYFSWLLQVSLFLTWWTLLFWLCMSVGLSFHSYTACSLLCSTTAMIVAFCRDLVLYVCVMCCACWLCQRLKLCMDFNLSPALAKNPARPVFLLLIPVNIMF